MLEMVRTPITQALADGVLTRKELKQLMRRSDKPGLLRLFIWFTLMTFTGSLIWLADSNWWLLVPAMTLHGIVLVHHFSLQHECTHFTAFKTRWLNDLVGHYCGLVIMLPPMFFRYEHCDHHTWTQLEGKDPELIPLPMSLREYLLYLSSWPYWRAKFAELFRHAAGRITQDEKKFVPKSERPRLFAEARWMLAFYVCIVTIMLIWSWWAPLWYWFIPVALGEPFMRAIRMTEHVGRPNIDDMGTNTRSNRCSALTSFLCWNMNYHAEHHYAASVPFHALPKLQAKLAGRIYVEPRGYWGAHLDILAQIFGRKPRANEAGTSS